MGVGALSLPKAFSDAGIILGTILLFILALTSYITATYMIEAMANANAYVKYLKRKKQKLVDAKSVPSIQVSECWCTRDSVYSRLCLGMFFCFVCFTFLLFLKIVFFWYHLFLINIQLYYYCPPVI